MTTDTLSIYETPVRMEKKVVNCLKGVLMTLCSKIVPPLFSVHGFAGQEESQNIWHQVSGFYTSFVIAINRPYKRNTVS